MCGSLWENCRLYSRQDKRYTEVRSVGTARDWKSQLKGEITKKSIMHKKVMWPVALAPKHWWTHGRVLA